MTEKDVLDSRIKCSDFPERRHTWVIPVASGIDHVYPGYKCPGQDWEIILGGHISPPWYRHLKCNICGKEVSIVIEKLIPKEKRSEFYRLEINNIESINDPPSAGAG